MSRQTFIGALRFDIARIGLVSRRYCGHSFRAGGATDLFASDGLLRCGELTSGRRGKHIKLRPGEKGASSFGWGARRRDVQARVLRCHTWGKGPAAQRRSSGSGDGILGAGLAGLRSSGCRS